MVVFGREPLSLRNVYASGGTGFLHEALVAAGGRNVFEDVARESVQASSEIIIARAPEAIVELRAVGLLDTATRTREEDVWRRLTSLPAVKGGRVHVIDGSALVVPGPRLADGLATLARVLHPGAL
jgi:iron complex transport system substrate-binding protein